MNNSIYRWMKLTAIAGLMCGAGGVPHVADAQTADYERPPIRYSDAQPDDAVSRLARALQEKRAAALPSSPQHGCLPALLRELQISPSSQTLVFSRTSFQQKQISPDRPRAIYFNDDTYVGFVPGGEVIEIAGTDPRLGTTFYTIPAAGAEPKVTRETHNCLQCHGESMTRGIPGLLVRSVFADAGGYPIIPAGGFLTTHESPLAERWGGWYVTGSSGTQPHMGNRRWREKPGQDPQPRPAEQSDVNGLPANVDKSAYLTPHSDIVALMVLEHQVEAHNRATRAAHGTLRALRDEQVMADALGEPLVPGEHSESTLRRIASSCEPLVEYLLFCGEARLTDQVKGSSDFAAEFSARGPRDAKGRSLRDFDLKTRLFRYPCSYLVYSTAITGLPEAAKDYVYRRLWEILNANGDADADADDERFAHLSDRDRAAIAEILRETEPNLRAAWARLDRARSPQ